MIIFQALDSPERIGFFIGTLLGGAGAGLICGLLPYFIGKKKDSRRLGKFALYACIVSGLILGIILALPMAIAFTIAIIVSRSHSLNKKPSDVAKESVNLT
jgi:hypothetical protein